MGSIWPTVFIDRYYDDDFDDEQPWRRARRCVWDARAEWSAYCEYGSHAEEEWFDDIEEALAWSREPAERVFVRLGASEATFYSAGSSHIHENADGSGRAYPLWPPDHWPDYRGPDAETRNV